MTDTNIAASLAQALRKLLGQVSNIEVLGENSALDTNISSSKQMRAKVDEIVAESRAAIAAYDASLRAHANAASEQPAEARNARSVGTGVVTEECVSRAMRIYYRQFNRSKYKNKMGDREEMRAVLEDFAAHHAAEGTRPQASGETGDALCINEWS